MEAWRSAIVPIRVLAMNSSESISKEALRLIDTCIFPIMNSGEYDAFLVSRHLAALCLMIVTASRENETDRPMFEPGYILSSACHAHHESLIKEPYKQYPFSVLLLRILITSPLCVHRRGKWYRRLAINLHTHLKDSASALITLQHATKDSHVKVYI